MHDSSLSEVYSDICGEGTSELKVSAQILSNDGPPYQKPSLGHHQPVIEQSGVSHHSARLKILHWTTMSGHKLNSSKCSYTLITDPQFVLARMVRELKWKGLSLYDEEG
jgi:hypothetical protein